MPELVATPGSVRRLRPALGTLVRIEIAHSDVASAAIDAAYRAIERIEASMSFHRHDSELRALMRAPIGTPVAIGEDLLRVLEFAMRLWTLSDGVFDPAIARTLVREGLLPRPEGPIPGARATFGDLELCDAGSVRLVRPLWLDLGGIAKGYAVDQALRALRDHGAQGACVNAGGDLACFGPVQRIGLRDPRAPHAPPHSTIELRDAAMATSAGYFQADALRGRGGRAPSRRTGSVTVIARDCMTADALTKVVWAAPRRARALLYTYAARALSLDARARSSWLNAA